MNSMAVGINGELYDRDAARRPDFDLVAMASLVSIVVADQVRIRVTPDSVELSRPWRDQLMFRLTPAELLEAARQWFQRAYRGQDDTLVTRVSIALGAMSDSEVPHATPRTADGYYVERVLRALANEGLSVVRDVDLEDQQREIDAGWQRWLERVPVESMRQAIHDELSEAHDLHCPRLAEHAEAIMASLVASQQGRQPAPVETRAEA